MRRILTVRTVSHQNADTMTDMRTSTQAADVADLVMARLGGSTTTKLQRTLYYCQGWHLAWDGKPLFGDRIEAWANGPVVRSIYELHRGVFVLPHPLPDDWDADRSRLGASERETVEQVVGHYGDWTADQLSVATHSERPWVEARSGLAPGERGERAIDLDVLQDYFSGLASAHDERA